MTIDVADRAQVLVEALPYIQRFHGRRIVIKVGGNALEQRKHETLQDIVLLRYVGFKPVLIHGGGAEINLMSERLGIKTEFVDGLRVTDEKTMEVVKMVLTGKINPDLVANLIHLGGQAHGMSGEDGPSIIAESEDPALGFVGRVTQVNSAPIEVLIDAGYIPVIASIGLGYDGNSYNINADTAAAEVAAALGAVKLLLLTDVPGVLDASGEVVSQLTGDQALAMIAGGSVTGGMIPKLRACLRAAQAGTVAHVIDGRTPHSLLLELFTEAGIGTMVTG